MQGIPQRLKAHLDKCHEKDDCVEEIRTPSLSSSTVSNFNDFGSPMTSENLNQTCETPRPAKVSRLMTDFVSVSRTTTCENQKLDIKVEKYFYATNTPFSHVDHTSFKELCSTLRPSYRPPSRHQIGGDLLNAVNEECQEIAKKALKDELVTLSLDGWTNVNNEPIVCIACTTCKGDTFLISTVDTSGNSQTAEYLEKLVQEAVELNTLKYGFKVVAFVTDNTGNVTKLRRNLRDSTIFETIFMYGCSTHILNLFAKDLNMPAVVSKIVEVNKYFRNHKNPSAWLKEKGAKKLQLPSDVRWYSIVQTLTSYLEAWADLLNIVDGHRDEIPNDIKRHVSDINLKRNVEDLAVNLRAIAIAIGVMESSKCNLAMAVSTWHDLTAELNEVVPTNMQVNIAKRKQQSLSSVHYLCFLLHPRFVSMDILMQDAKNMAFELARELHPDMLATIMQFKVQERPFNAHYFEAASSISPAAWWKLIPIDPDLSEIIRRIIACSPSTAPLERLFSSFGIIHTNVRNRLGVEKAGKLVFCFKVLNL